MNPTDTIGNIFNPHKQQNGNHLDQLQKYCMKHCVGVLFVNLKVSI